MMNKKFSWKNDHWIKPYLAQYKWNFLLAIFLGVVMFFCGGALMFYAGYTIDKAATRPENILMIYVPIVLMRAVGIGRPLFRYLERLVSHNWILRVTSSLRRRLFYIAEKNTSAVGSSFQTGSILSLLTDDIGHLQNLYLRTIFPAILSYLVGFIVVILLGLFSWSLAGVIAILLVAELVLVPLFSLLKQAAVRTKEKEEKAQLYTEFTDQVLGAGDWKISGRRDAFFNQTKGTLKSLGQHEKKSGKFDWARDFGLEFIFGLMAVALLYFTNQTLTYNQEAANYVGAVVLALFPLSDAFIPVGQGIEEWHTYSDSVKHLNELKVPENTLPAQKHLDPALADTLRVSDISFTYPKEDYPIIQNFSLTLKRGQKAALIGPSGAGKSTILQLILGDLKPNQGTVTLDNFNVLELQKERSKLFSVLNQEPFLFNTTIYENLKMANPNANADQMMQILEKVQLADFVNSLPKKLDTEVAEAGARFSGGQKERLALARVLLQDTPIVLLDEPTVGLDPLTEQKLLNLVFDVLKNKTVVWVTHHLQGVKYMNEVLFFKDGKVTMQGDPHELFKHNEHFHQLYLMDQGLI